jgi:hypothetical protein
MSSISKRGEGNFYFIKDLSMVDEAFVDAVGALFSVVV